MIVQIIKSVGEEFTEASCDKRISQVIFQGREKIEVETSKVRCSRSDIGIIRNSDGASTEWARTERTCSSSNAI